MDETVNDVIDPTANQNQANQNNVLDDKQSAVEKVALPPNSPIDLTHLTEKADSPSVNNLDRPAISAETAFDAPQNSAAAENDNYDGGEDAFDKRGSSNGDDDSSAAFSWDNMKHREWGKRDLSDASAAEKKWAEQSRLWGKRSWAASNRNWGKRADDNDAMQEKRWGESSSRLWGKRSGKGLDGVCFYFIFHIYLSLYYTHI